MAFVRVGGLAAIVCGGSALVGFRAGPGQTQLPTTAADFFQPGTQPILNNLPLTSGCTNCHNITDELDGNPVETTGPWNTWVSTMMAQAARDPVWRAAVQISNQDAAVSGEFCIRCHSPVGWLRGHSTSGQISGLVGADLDGVNCAVCHRLVDPVFDGNSPPGDAAILAALGGNLPLQPGNARYVIDPNDSRRGPFFDVPFNMHNPVPIIPQVFHSESLLCATCHDVSNPMFTYNSETDSYELNPNGVAHPTQVPGDMMPEQRTFSEWANSQFAAGGVVFEDGRFGGDLPNGTPIQSCQDCHMPDVHGGACAFWESEPFFKRTNMPQHSFAGANTWVLAAIESTYLESETGLNPDNVAAAGARTEVMLRNASDMQVRQVGGNLCVRVINWSGHKLPTGFPEGRRMWINVRFFDDMMMPVGEYGSYNPLTGDLVTSDTKVYEMSLGMDETIAAQANLPAGKSFHLTLNNVVLKDNRIPPVGFTNAAFEAARAEPVDYAYVDGQHWDDTVYAIPKGATSTVATLYYQTTSKEYIEFLRDADSTATVGPFAYELWVNHGQSAPLDMDSITIPLVQTIAGDIDLDTDVDVTDLLELLAAWGPCPLPPDLCLGDINCDGVVNVTDLLLLLANWS